MASALDDILAERDQQTLALEAERRAAAAEAAARAQAPPVSTGAAMRGFGALGGVPVPATSAPAPPVPPTEPGPPVSIPSAASRGLSVLGGMPVVTPPAEINPPEQPSVRPGLPATIDWIDKSERPSPATRAILEANRDVGGEPTVEGAGPGVFGSAIRSVAGPVLSVLRGEGVEGDKKPAATVTTSSSSVEATTPKVEPTAEAVKPAAKPKPDNPKGAAGVPGSATRGRGPADLPDVTDKAWFNPRLLVELEKSNPALHDQIVQASQAAGISSGEYANIVMAVSNGDPSVTSKEGRVGYAGLTPEDGVRYKRMYPQLFQNSQREPVDIKDPATNMLVGALKYREMSDIYGSRTPSAIAAYWLGPGRVDELSRMTPAQQRERLGEARDLVRKSIDPDAKEGSAPVDLRITDQGTMTAQGAGRALSAAAKAGNPMIVASYMADTLPRGMSANDGWRHLEARMVGTFIMAGDMAGAQHARELVFQMSQVGATQSLMRAHRDLQMGDLHGAAQQLARAYFFAPDGGLAKFSVTKDGLYGQRYNEATRQPIGGAFQVTPERIQGMLNIARDAPTYLKTLQESQKTNAEIEAKHAETKYKLAHAKYMGDVLPSLERRAETAADTSALRGAATLAAKDTAGANKLDPRVALVNKEIEDFYDLKTLEGTKTPMTPDFAAQIGLFRDMRLSSDLVDPAAAKLIAADLITVPQGGRFMVRLAKDGGGVVFDRKTNGAVAKLSPLARQQFQARGGAVGAAPAAPAAVAPRAGAEAGF